MTERGRPKTQAQKWAEEALKWRVRAAKAEELLMRAHAVLVGAAPAFELADEIAVQLRKYHPKS